MNVQIAARIDENIKEAATRVVEKQGLDLSTVFRILVTKIANEHRIPLDISTSSENYPAMDESEFFEFMHDKTRHI